MKLLIAIALFFSIQSHAQTIQERLKPPLVAAHQGGYPWKGENNTIPKFLNAVKDGADIIETDLHVTKDGIVIIYHNDDLKENTACTGNVWDKTYEEIKKCPYNNGRPIETFEDVLLTINGTAIVNAEFKVQNVVVPAIKLVQKYNAYDWVYFQTKAERDRYLLARQTDSRVALNYKAKTDVELDWALSFNDPYLVIIEMEKEMATPTNIKKTHVAQKLVSVNSWRYGSFEEIFSAACDKVFKLGIDIGVANNISSCVKQKQQRQKTLL
jgi:glycerophosphoryl diester phosphodiesterase